MDLTSGGSRVVRFLFGMILRYAGGGGSQSTPHASSDQWEMASLVSGIAGMAEIEDKTILHTGDPDPAVVDRNAMYGVRAAGGGLALTLQQRSALGAAAAKKAAGKPPRPGLPVVPKPGGVPKLGGVPVLPGQGAPNLALLAPPTPCGGPPALALPNPDGSAPASGTAAPRVVSMTDAEYGKAKQILDKCDKYKDSAAWIGVYVKVRDTSPRTMLEAWDKYFVFHSVKA